MKLPSTADIERHQMKFEETKDPSIKELIFEIRCGSEVIDEFQI